MTIKDTCRCLRPLPAVTGEGVEFCHICGKYLPPVEKKGAKISDEEAERRIRSLERQMRQFQLQLQDLKERRASRE